MLASWFCATDIGWPVVIHDDGTLSENARDALRQSFGSALRIVDRAEADADLDVWIKAFPFCDEFRTAHTQALKVFDTAHFSDADRFIVFDPDVLFFKEPREIRAWADAGLENCWFGEDAVEGALVTAAEARDELGVKLWRRVDTGICLLSKAAIDLDFCDRALAQTSILKGTPDRIASTLLTLCASQLGAGGLLPKSYEVSMEGSVAAEAVARHYIGAVRDRFCTEGVSRIRESVLSVGED